MRFELHYLDEQPSRSPQKVLEVGGAAKSVHLERANPRWSLRATDSPASVRGAVREWSVRLLQFARQCPRWSSSRSATWPGSQVSPGRAAICKHTHNAAREIFRMNVALGIPTSRRNAGLRAAIIRNFVSVGEWHPAGLIIWSFAGSNPAADLWVASMSYRSRINQLKTSEGLWFKQFVIS